MKKKKLPIMHGYVEVSEEKYNRLVESSELEAFKAMYEPRGAGGGGATPNLSTHIIPNVRRHPIQ